jgi:hypothetical protein
MEYRFINHDSCAGESLERVADDKDVTWEDGFRGDAVPSDFARRLERQRDELLGALERIAPRTSDKWARDACEDAIAAVKGGQP